MHNFWVLACHVSEVAEPGDFVVLPWMADGSQVAVTNFSGTVVAWNGLCTHRGARIYDGMAGNGPAKCRYHGRCMHAAGVDQLQMEIVGPWVYVNTRVVPTSKGGIGAEFMPHKPAPLTYPQRFPFVTNAPEVLRLHSTLRLVMDCDWRVAVENALDSEHVKHVHGANLNRVDLRLETTTTANGSSLDEFTVSDVVRDHLDALRSKAVIAASVPWPWDCDYVHAHLFPYTCVSSMRGVAYSVQHYFPRADGGTEFIHRLYAPDYPGLPREYFDGVAAMNERVFREDAEICARVPTSSLANWSGLGQNDDRIKHFRSVQHKTVSA